MSFYCFNGLLVMTLLTLGAGSEIASQKSKEKEKIFQIELIYGTPWTKAGTEIVLSEEGFSCFKGRRISDEGIKEIFREAGENGHSESVLNIQIYRRYNPDLKSLASVIKKLKALRDPELPTYIYFALNGP